MANFDFKTLTFIKASELPVTSRFRTSTPALSISENGQGRLSKAILSHEAWAGKEKLYIGWDAESRTLGVMPIGDKLPKGVTEADLFTLKSGAKHPESKYLSIAGVCKVIGYDFAGSGNQTFDVELGAKGEFAVVIPTSLPKRDITPRKKKIAASVKAEAGSTTKIAEPDEDPFA